MRFMTNQNPSAVGSPSLDDLRLALQQKDGLLWLDLNNENVEKCQEIFEKVFQFHPLAIDDALIETHIPKVDDWGEYLYLALIGVDAGQPLDNIDKSLELDIFLGSNFVVTYHPEHIQAIEIVWAICQRDVRSLQRGANFLIYQIVDELANEYMLQIDKMDQQVEDIEDHVMQHADPAMLQSIFSIKRSLLNMRRIVAPQREVLNKLSRGDFPLVSQKERMYYRDVYDHMVRVQDITENLRELVGGALDTYLSVVNNRLNNIMKTLTIITTVFMPLTFLTGFFGMNFFEPLGSQRAWTSSPVFLLTWAVMLVLPLGMYLWMRRRDWM